MEIRKAKRGDETGIHQLIVELAVFELAPNDVINTPAQLAIDLFEDKICNCLVVEFEKQIIGFALYYTSYSTWKGRCLYLEDFYVQPAYRGRKVGDRLFDQVVEIAKELGVKRMDWQVLDWNVDAQRFYQRKNATLDNTWVNGRIFFD